MPDLILISRLDSLEQNLTQIVNNSIWLKNCVLKPCAIGESGATRETWPEGTWDALDATVVTEARALLNRLQQIRGKLLDDGTKDPKISGEGLIDPWKNYQEVYKLSQDVFSECLEYIGGLALRDRGFDQRICHIADKLIFSCGMDWINFRWQSLTILAAQERLGQTLARIVRLRFPEWTIWTLPFTAREFAHVALQASESQKIWDFVKKKVRDLMDKDPTFADAQNAEPAGSDNLKWEEERARLRAENHIHGLVADIFATYTMGPAYACAALLLRFNPVEPSSESNDRLSDAKRAEVVLGTLKKLNQNVAGEEPYSGIIKRLEDEWNSARAGVTSSAGTGTLSSAQRLEDKIDCAALIRETTDVFLTRVRPAGLFAPGDIDSGWQKARDWRGRLMTKLKSGWLMHNWDGFGITQSSRLRDALNAAWLCRIYVRPQDNVSIARISEAALALCEKIIEHSKPADNGGPHLVPSLPGGQLPPAQGAFSKQP